MQVVVINNRNSYDCRMQAVGPRSGCPINQAIEVIGDPWSLIVLRDIMFGQFRSFRALHQHNIEGIATNILASRLKKLVAEGMLTNEPDPAHRQRTIYSLTEASISLVPVIAQLGAWGVANLNPSHGLSVRAIALAEGGPKLWDDFMAELRHIHLCAPPPRRSVLAMLDSVYSDATAARAE